MSMDNQLTLVEDIPIDNPSPKKKKDFNNILSDVLNELMSERNISESQIVKETGIPWPTINDWVRYRRKSQALDDNVIKLARYLGVTLEYLAFGIGDEHEGYGRFDEK